MLEKYKLARNDERLFFVVLQPGHADIFSDDRVEDFWLFWEDVGCDPEAKEAVQYDMYHVVMKALNAATQQLVREWRALPYVCFVERNQILERDGDPLSIPSLQPIKRRDDGITKR